jgi:hypothetical protein
MFNVSDWWRHRSLIRSRQAIGGKYVKKRAALEKDQTKNAYDFAALEADEYYEEESTQEAVNSFYSRRLIDEASGYDIEIPSSNKQLWVYSDNGEHWFLNAEGRDLLRGWIKKAKDQSSEDWERRAKIFVPIIAGVTGFIGAITGLVAIFLHKK